MADERGVDGVNFTLGSQIKCRYQSGQGQVEGQVAAFQNSSRLLLVRAPASNGKSTFNNVYIINADCLEKISVDERTNPDVENKPVDFTKLEKRRKKAIGLKKARIRALSADVPPEGRKLFLSIIKTYGNELDVAWEGENIVVLNHVKISPPYKSDDVKSENGEKDAAVIQIKKIVDKHWKDLQSNTSITTNNN